MKERISQSAYALLDTNRFSELTVQKIADRCGISRKTFYNHFADKSAVFEWTVGQKMVMLASSISPDYHWREALRDVLMEIDQTKKYCRRLSTSEFRTNLSDRLYWAHLEVYDKNEIKVTSDLRYQTEFFCHACIESIGRWLVSGCSLPVDDLCARLARCLPIGIYAVLSEKDVF